MADLNYGTGANNRAATTRVGFDDYLFPSFALGKGASAPDLEVFRDGLQAFAFSGSGPVEEAFGAIHILHDYKQGSNVFIHTHWGHKILSPSGDVVWQIEFSHQKGHDQGVFPASTTIELQQTVGPQFTHQIIEDASGFNSNLEPDSIVLFRVFRDPAHANDTFANDAFLFFLDIHVQVDNIFTNEKAAPFTKNNP